MGIDADKDIGLIDLVQTELQRLGVSRRPVFMPSGIR